MIFIWCHCNWKYHMHILILVWLRYFFNMKSFMIEGNYSWKIIHVFNISMVNIHSIFGLFDWTSLPMYQRQLQQSMPTGQDWLCQHGFSSGLPKHWFCILLATPFIHCWGNLLQACISDSCVGLHFASVGLHCHKYSVQQHQWHLLLTWFNFNPSMDK